MAKRSYTLSPAALAQRKANGQRLAARVDRDYFRFIGRRGGRRLMFNTITALAYNWQLPEGWPVRVSPAVQAELRQELTEHYLEQANKYKDDKGTKVMLALWQ